MNLPDMALSQLCRMLEADVPQSQSCVDLPEPGPNINDAGAILDFGSNDYMQQRRRSFVSYAAFLEAYWSHFPRQWTKGLGTVCHNLRKGYEIQLASRPSIGIQ